MSVSVPVPVPVPVPMSCVLCLVCGGQLQFVRAFYCSMAVLQRFEPTEPFPFPLLCPGF